MSDYIKVNIDSLKHDTETIEALIGDLREKISELEVMAGNLQQLWIGEASQNFQNAFRNDLEALHVICENLQKISKYEENAQIKYKTCELQAADCIAELNI